MHQRHRDTIIIDSVLNRHANQSLTALLRDGLDTKARACGKTDPVRAKFRLQKVNETLHLLGARGILNPSIDVLGVLAKHHHVRQRCILHWGGYPGEIAYRSNTGEKIERLSHHDVQRTNAAPNGRGQRSFDGDHILA